jgi:hypothetical protein
VASKVNVVRATPILGILHLRCTQPRPTKESMI